MLFPYGNSVGMNCSTLSSYSHLSEKTLLLNYARTVAKALTAPWKNKGCSLGSKTWKEVQVRTQTPPKVFIIACVGAGRQLS